MSDVKEIKGSNFIKAFMSKDFMKGSKGKLAEKNLQQEFKAKHLEVVSKLTDSAERLVSLRTNIVNEAGKSCYDLEAVLRVKKEISDRVYSAGEIKKEYFFMFGKEMKEDMKPEEALEDLLGAELAHDLMNA